MQTKWRKAVIIAGVVVFLDVLFLYLGTSKILHITWSVASVGIVSFFGILMLVNYLSESPALEKGEVRKALAGSFIVVYFTIISLFTFTEFSLSDTGIAKTIIGHFTYLIGIIIVFYFASSSVREFLKTREKREN